MKNVLLLADDPIDQCSYYRLWPFLQLAESGYGRVANATARSCGRVEGADVLSSDVVFLLRPHTEQHANLMRAARQMGKPVWIDYDDDFLNLEEHHYFAERFGSYKARATFQGIGSLASVITVSTQPIADTWSKISPAPISVIPNAFNDKMHVMPVGHNAASNVIVWRGSYSHCRDLEMIKGLVAAFPKMQFVFMGSFHYSLPEQLPTAKFYPFMPMAQYFATIKQLQPRLFLVPLQDTQFNRSKSNCAWIEATYAGAAVVATDLPEFDMPGITPARHSWPDAVEYALGSSSLRWKESHNYITKNLTLSSANIARTMMLSQFV